MSRWTCVATGVRRKGLAGSGEQHSRTEGQAQFLYYSDICKAGITGCMAWAPHSDALDWEGGASIKQGRSQVLPVQHTCALASHDRH